MEVSCEPSTRPHTCPLIGILVLWTSLVRNSLLSYRKDGTLVRRWGSLETVCGLCICFRKSTWISPLDGCYMYMSMIVWSPLLWWEFGKGKHYLWNSRYPLPWESGTAQGDEVTLQEEWWPDDKVLHQPCLQGGDHKCNWGDAHQGKKQLYVEWAVCTAPPIHNAIVIILLHSQAAWNSTYPVHCFGKTGSWVSILSS